MTEPATVNTTDLLITLADQMVDLLRTRSRAVDDPAALLIDEYTRASQVYTVISDRIQSFNRAVAAAFEAGDPAALRPLLTPGGYDRMTANFQRWRAAGIRDLVLEGCEMLALNQPAGSAGHTARALTLESWLFVDEHGGRKPEVSLNMYTLALEEVVWKIERVEFYVQG